MVTLSIKVVHFSNGYKIVFQMLQKTLITVGASLSAVIMMLYLLRWKKSPKSVIQKPPETILSEETPADNFQPQPSANMENEVDSEETNCTILSEETPPADNFQPQPSANEENEVDSEETNCNEKILNNLLDSYILEGVVNECESVCAPEASQVEAVTCPLLTEAYNSSNAVEECKTVPEQVSFPNVDLAVGSDIVSLESHVELATSSSSFTEVELDNSNDVGEACEGFSNHNSLTNYKSDENFQEIAEVAESVAVDGSSTCIGMDLSDDNFSFAASLAIDYSNIESNDVTASLIMQETLQANNLDSQHLTTTQSHVHLNEIRNDLQTTIEHSVPNEPTNTEVIRNNNLETNDDNVPSNEQLLLPVMPDSSSLPLHQSDSYINLSSAPLDFALNNANVREILVLSPIPLSLQTSSVETVSEGYHDTHAVETLSQGHHDTHAVETVIQGHRDNHAVETVSQGYNDNHAVETVSQGYHDIHAGLVDNVSPNSVVFDNQEIIPQPNDGMMIASASEGQPAVPDYPQVPEHLVNQEIPMHDAASTAKLFLTMARVRLTNSWQSLNYSTSFVSIFSEELI